MSVSDEESFVILGSSPVSSLMSPSLLLNSSKEKSLEEFEKEVTKSKSDVEDPIINVSESEDVKNMLESAIFTSSKQSGSSGTSTKESIKNGMNSFPSGDSLAASFLLGEVNSDVLKSSVYSQFPNFCSMESCAEEVLKLQTFMSEYVKLKDTLFKVNVTMKEFYNQTKQWKESIEERQNQQKIVIRQFHDQIADLCKENKKLKSDLENKIEIGQNKHMELVQSVSEKSTIIEKQIEKLEQQQSIKENNAEYVPLMEHQRKVKEIERTLSEIAAENLNLKEIQKQNINKIECLKVNLLNGEDLLRQSRTDIELLQMKDNENQNILSKYENENCQMKEDIFLLREQVEIFRKDFEMERVARQNLAGEKDHLLSDLRILQRKNHELILEEQKRLERKVSNKLTIPITLKEQTKNCITKLNQTNPKNLKTEEMPSTSSSSSLSSELIQNSLVSHLKQPIKAVVTNICPICDVSFESLSVLQKHANECLDKN